LGRPNVASGEFFRSGIRQQEAADPSRVVFGRDGRGGAVASVAGGGGAALSGPVGAVVPRSVWARCCGSTFFSNGSPCPTDRWRTDFTTSRACVVSRVFPTSRRLFPVAVKTLSRSRLSIPREHRQSHPGRRLLRAGSRHVARRNRVLGLVERFPGIRQE
jgi:hypothetical protein